MAQKIRIILVFSFLIIVNQANTQSLTLKAIAESNKATTVIDSIGYNNTFSNYKTLETEVSILKDKLIKSGYIDTRIESILKENDTLFNASIYIGVKLNFIKVFFKPNFNIGFLQLTDASVKANSFEINISKLETTLNIINKAIAEEGDPFSSLQLINIRKEDSKTIAGDLVINNNQKRSIDKIVIKGYDKFPKSYIKRFLKLKEGKPFNLEEIKEKTRFLEELRFAREIKDPEVLFTNDSTILYLYTEKTPSNNFDGFLGFGSNENTNKVEFDGYLNLQLINNLNYGESLRILYKSDEIDQQTFDLKINAPYLFGSPIGLDLGLNLFRKDSIFSTATQHVRLNYQVNANHKIGMGISTTNSSTLLDNDTSILNDYTTNYYQFNYNYIKPQYYDPLFPINFWFDITTSFGNRTQNDIEQTQSAFTLETYKIFNLNNKNIVFIRVTGATLTSADYLDNELFRFGGINSIRGFEENSLVSNLYGVLNTEYRYRLSNTLYVHSVFDAAYTENEITNSTDKLFGFGVGFGLLTQTGLFKLNYSSGKTENSQFKLSDSKIHVSLTATF
jgi:outer membrane protein assembly factor BamA